MNYIFFDTETNSGRLLYIDADGTVRWSYVNRAENGNVYIVKNRQVINIPFIKNSANIIGSKTINNIHVSNNLNSTKLLQEHLHNSYLINSQLLDIKYIKIPRMLKYTDRMSMRFGVEARVPFLDHELFEYCFNLSHNFKFKNGESRYLLKKISREINSKISFTKNKINIVDPQKSWLKTHLKDFILDELNSIDFINNEFINNEENDSWKKTWRKNKGKILDIEYLWLTAQENNYYLLHQILAYFEILL